ncbi:MAG: hypothetical protein HDR33_10880 [Treponema sp.]|nr:hypothetical protein [Treponema sp.]
MASRPSPRRAPLCVISGKIRVPDASLACFQASGVLPLLRWSIFGFRERSQGFAGAFSGFGSTPVASLRAFSCFGSVPKASL